jgi:L-threonylcarbamoyladenylate synthase
MTQRLAPDASGLAQAVQLIGTGGLVAFPTETVYGLGADATDAKAVAGIFAAKQRPSFNPLIAHVPDLPAAEREGLFGPQALRLARRFWPGPLTLVVKRAPRGRVCDLAAAARTTIGLRIPDHPLALALLAGVDRPVAAPSANRSGRVSPTSAAHVLADLDGRIAAVLDGGPTPVGVESTIVACLPGHPPRLLRPGGIAAQDIEAELGEALIRHAPDMPDMLELAAPLAPGMLASHYAPRARVRLNAASVQPGEAVLSFGGARPSGTTAAVAVRDLSASGDLVEAAAHLFAHLRALDETSATTIAVTPIPREGLGEAINDRLERAAAPRP